MARILYGISGEGSGHSSRAREIMNYLESNGHIIKAVSYGRGYGNLAPHFDVEKIHGLHFAYKNNEVRYLETAFSNLLSGRRMAGSIERVSNLADEFGPNIVFSDFEPVSCIVANIKKLPLISIDNQHRLNNTRIEYPKKYKKEALAAIAVTNLMIFGSKACLVTDFARPQVTSKKTFLFPPILRREVLEAETSEGDYILVYLTSQFSRLIEIFRGIRKKFVIYGFNRDEEEGNLVFKKAGQDNFLKDLAGCQGVVANAGFTLITEALYLGKPYLALPVGGQFEQVFNAYTLEKLGYGKYWDELDKERIESFLFNLGFYRENLASYHKEDNSKIFQKIDELIDTFALVEKS